MTPHPRPRLSAEDWLMAGFRALADRGPSALRAEALARDLGTTKGSFYWHFKDLPDYLAKLIALWETRAFGDILASLDPDLPPRGRLEQLCFLAAGCRDPSYGGIALEPALRAWALSAPDVAEALKRMDARRIEALTDLCAGSGITDPAAPRALYALAVGIEALADDAGTEAMRLLLRGL
ncbi:TetR/AcrR family transcriptional regulator [Roseinatronobacter monicus]|uniref:TetR family transcriptional regulator n=1 Tax=Roseinatronobacter monicus TaxID=393481 RepID=A0A543K4B0_9RHOB|nr:TetR/AcrR family transcriptional regulator [Roseinatronobacter monicus]TQM89919.1 TetR family transcriptional regulator [Roseinatronobacter monicus]